MADWQPIETAPRDGTSVLLACPGADNIFIGAWKTAYSELGRGDHTGWWSNGAKNASLPLQLILAPSFWMPLPEMPQ